MNKLLFTAASCVALSSVIAPANAQSIDYSTMTELFGEPVTTSATGKPQRMSEVPLTMEILTQDDIRRSGAVDLAEVLRQVNGVNVVQKTSQQYDVAIRGYNQHNSQRLLILVNGRQVYLDHYGYTEWATIPVRLEEIQQIEIVKGPNTALFGFNAVNGVVNIVTYNPLYDDKSSAGVTVGTQDYREAHYMQSFKLGDKLGVRFSGGKRDADAFDTTLNSASGLLAGSNRAEFEDNKLETLNMDAVWQATDKSQVRLELSGSNVDTPRTNSLGSLQNSEYETKAAKVSYQLDSDWGLIKANVYKNFLDWNYQTAVNAAFSKVDQSVLVAQLEDTIQINNNHTARIQLEYRDNQMESPALLHDDAEISYQVYAASGMWNWKINDDWSWTNAVRVDQLEMEHNGLFLANSPLTEAQYDNADLTEFSYNSGLWWSPTPHDTVRLSTARGLEVPSLLEFGIDIDSPPVYLGGNPDAVPATVTNYELAWDRKLDSIDGMFRSALFYNKTEDVKALFSNINGLNFFTDNVGSTKSHGVELELKGKLDQNIDWGIGYIYQDMEDTLANNRSPFVTYPPGSSPYPKEFEKSNPQHQVNLKIGYADGPLEIDTLAYYVSKTEQFTLAGGVGPYVFEDVDAYIGLNARVGYTFDNDIIFAVSGQQIQNSDTQTSTTPDVESRFFMSLSKKF